MICEFYISRTSKSSFLRLYPRINTIFPTQNTSELWCTNKTRNREHTELWCTSKTRNREHTELPEVTSPTTNTLHREAGCHGNMSSSLDIKIWAPIWKLMKIVFWKSGPYWNGFCAWECKEFFVFVLFRVIFKKKHFILVRDVKPWTRRKQ